MVSMKARVKKWKQTMARKKALQNPVDLSHATAATIAELRAAFRVQQEYENETKSYVEVVEQAEFQKKHGSKFIKQLEPDDL